MHRGTDPLYTTLYRTKNKKGCPSCPFCCYSTDYLIVDRGTMGQKPCPYRAPGVPLKNLGSDLLRLHKRSFAPTQKVVRANENGTNPAVFSLYRARLFPLSGTSVPFRRLLLRLGEGVFQGHGRGTVGAWFLAYCAPANYLHNR